MTTPLRPPQQLKTALQALAVRPATQAPATAPAAPAGGSGDPAAPPGLTVADMGAALRAMAAPAPSVRTRRRRKAAP